jgi:hypothetical protein
MARGEREPLGGWERPPPPGGPSGAGSSEPAVTPSRPASRFDRAALPGGGVRLKIGVDAGEAGTFVCSSASPLPWGWESPPVTSPEAATPQPRDQDGPVWAICKRLAGRTGGKEGGRGDLLASGEVRTVARWTEEGLRCFRTLGGHRRYPLGGREAMAHPSRRRKPVTSRSCVAQLEQRAAASSSVLAATTTRERRRAASPRTSARRRPERQPMHGRRAAGAGELRRPSRPAVGS